MNEGKMFKSKIRGSIQEVILPDFPDDDNTVTTTTTRSRRVSFGTNLVKEFIVGSAVSAQCVSEYEQAFSSSDSSNANSSLSFVNSSIRGQSTFTVENLKNSISQNTFTIENNKEQLRHSTFTVENEKENIRQNTFTMEKQKEHHSIAGKTFCEFDPNENQPKRPKFSRTICFNVDSPTADMEFTEGCLTLAKTILDKKNKDMRVIIQAESKEEDKVDKNESTKHFGSIYDMNLTQCVTGKENKRSNKSFQGEKSKIFSVLGDDTENCTLFSKKLPSNISESSLDDSLKENQVPLDVIMQQLDKNNSDSEDSLYPEKTLNAALNASIFDSDEKDDKLSLNESMDISLDFPPKRATSMGDKEEIIQHLSNTDEFDKHLLIENHSPSFKLEKSNNRESLSLNDKQDSFLEEVERDINTELAKEMGEEEMEISLNKVEEMDMTHGKGDILENENQALDNRLEVRRESGVEKQTSEITEDITINPEFHNEIFSLEKINETAATKENEPEPAEISLEIKECGNDKLEVDSFTNEIDESKNISNLNQSERIENKESGLDEFRKDENGMLAECSNTEKEDEEIINITPTTGSNVISDQPAEEVAQISLDLEVNNIKLADEPIEESLPGNSLKEQHTEQIIPSPTVIDERIIEGVATANIEVTDDILQGAISNKKNQGSEEFEEVMELSLVDSDTTEEQKIEKPEDILDSELTNSKFVEDHTMEPMGEPDKIIPEPPPLVDTRNEEGKISINVNPDQPTEEFSQINLELEMTDSRLLEKPVEENISGSRLVDQPIKEIITGPSMKNEEQTPANFEEIISDIPQDAITNNKSQAPEELEEVEELPLVDNKIAEEQNMENSEEIVKESKLALDNIIMEDPTMEISEDIVVESQLVDSKIVEDQVMETVEELDKITTGTSLIHTGNKEDKVEEVEVFMEPPLVDSRIIEDLKAQSEESNCLWTLKNWKYNARNNTGMWNFKFQLLESYLTLTFKLIVSREDAIPHGVVQSSSILLDEEEEYRRKEYHPAVEFGYLHQKAYLEEKKKMVKTVRQIPYFLDLMNSYIIRLNSYLSQIYSILTLYPGSDIQNSILAFRLFSFPLSFSCNVTVNLTDLYRLSKSSVSFEYDFGTLDENEVQEIFGECLKLDSPLVEFIIRSTKYIIDVESKSGRVSKRSYIRLLPTEYRY